MEPRAHLRADGAVPARPISVRVGGNAFVTGAVVLTQDGALPVEYLNPGDRVATRDGGMAELKVIRLRTRTVRTLSFAAGSMGNMRPDSDALLPATQQVLVRDWRAQALFGTPQALVRADRLVDGAFVRDLGNHRLALVELLFDRVHILYVDGLEQAATQPVLAND